MCTGPPAVDRNVDRSSAVQLSEGVVAKCGPARGAVDPRTTKAPPERGFRAMRRRGLEPPPGYPGPGPQPGASTNSAIGARATASIARGVRVESVRSGIYLVRTHVRPVEEIAKRMD